MLGWLSYFRIAQTTGFAALEQWTRQRLRALIMKQRHARTHHRWWRMAEGAKSILPNSYFDKLGLPRLSEGGLNNTNRRMRPRMSGGVGGA
jgi:hypothetical protein